MPPAKPKLVMSLSGSTSIILTVSPSLFGSFLVVHPIKLLSLYKVIPLISVMLILTLSVIGLNIQQETKQL